MTENSQSERQLQDPLGLRLRQARQKLGLSVEQAAHKLRLPLAIVDAMEREDWAALGAPLYLRNYLVAYLRLLALPTVIAESVASQRTAPELIAMQVHSPVRRHLDRVGKQLAYASLTLALVIPLGWLALHYQNSDRVGRAIDLDPAAAADAMLTSSSPVSLPPASTPTSSDAPPGAAPEAAGSSAAASQPQPLVAGMTPFAAAPTPRANVVANELVLRFLSESWVDVLDQNGQSLERGMVPAGSERRYPPGSAARLTLGDFQAVEVTLNGQPVNLAPFADGNVVRFAVSSDGSIPSARPAANR